MRRWWGTARLANDEGIAPFNTSLASLAAMKQTDEQHKTIEKRAQSLINMPHHLATMEYGLYRHWDVRDGIRGKA
jgi:hypothetical protein